MRVLYIGGSGEISKSCVDQSVRAGQEVIVYNRGKRQESLPASVHHIEGDIRDKPAYQQLADQQYDVVCQFLAYTEETIATDLGLFAGNCGQYIFISTASAYQKPCQHHVITEETPLDNPFWLYSRVKAACESRLKEQDTLPFTIVRPSHTYRTRFPSTVIDGDHLAWRLKNNKPVPVHGDGESLWTLTHSDDFARAFVGLFGNEEALGNTVHITDSGGYTWNVILREVAATLEKEPAIIPITTQKLCQYNPDWTGPLLGDKSNSVIFDNSKINQLVGGWECEIDLATGLALTADHIHSRFSAGYEPDPAQEQLIDRIISEQT